MKADKQFDFYEFAGIVMPGAILLVGLTQVSPKIAAIIPSKDMSLGSLGLFLILAYATGHLLQAAGNLVESVWWFFPGMPSVRAPDICCRPVNVPHYRNSSRRN